MAPREERRPPGYRGFRPCGRGKNKGNNKAGVVAARRAGALSSLGVLHVAAVISESWCVLAAISAACSLLTPEALALTLA